MRLVIVTHFASPYQAELFNSVAAFDNIDLAVVYLHRTHVTRQWTDGAIHHEAIFLDQEPACFDDGSRKLFAADIAVLNYYVERPARVLFGMRAKTGRPWCFWGERPGLRKPPWIGRLMRRLYLAPLYNSLAPIWGVGRFAVERYQTEFGSKRRYYNLPYFSNLERFNLTKGIYELSATSERVFLFSGSLILRKGADLLARAFVRLAGEVSNVRLKLMGEGRLRGILEQTLRPLKNCVEFLGFKEWAELPECYARAHILCVPSRYDGWGLVVPEGLASGLPVIGTDRTGAALEFIRNRYNGWLVEAGNEDSLYAALREAALLPYERIAEMSSRARESVRDHSLEDGAQRFVHAAQDTVKNWET